jgi:hypothetical protein
VGLVIFAAFVPIGFVEFFGTDERFFLVWAVLVVCGLVHALFRMPYRIDLDGDEVEFRMLARTQRTRISRIRSIRGNDGAVTIRFDDGSVELADAFDDFYDFHDFRQARQGRESGRRAEGRLGQHGRLHRAADHLRGRLDDRPVRGTGL